MICPETGKPYYYHSDEASKTMIRKYDLPLLEVPESLRKYLVGRGYLFHAYTKHFDENDMGFHASVDVFLDKYPSWEEVMSNEEFRDDIPDYWNEDDHNGFKRLLEWCCKQECYFQVTWSY